MEKSLTLNKEIVLSFNDIEKAFDNVDWNTMLRVLREARINYRDRRIILQPKKNQRALLGHGGQQPLGLPHTLLHGLAPLSRQSRLLVIVTYLKRKVTVSYTSRRLEIC